MKFPLVRLDEVLRQRKQFITIDDDLEYKLCRVQTNQKGIVLRSLMKGAEIKSKKQQICKENDLLVAEIDAKVGGYGIVPSELDGAIVSNHYYLFELDEGVISIEYMKIILSTNIIQRQIKSVGSTNYAAIRSVDFLNYSIPLPDLSEQKTFASKYVVIINQIQELKIATTDIENNLTNFTLSWLTQ